MQTKIISGCLVDWQKKGGGMNNLLCGRFHTKVVGVSLCREGTLTVSTTKFYSAQSLGFSDSTFRNLFHRCSRCAQRCRDKVIYCRIIYESKTNNQAHKQTQKKKSLHEEVWLNETVS